jgi:amidase
LAEAFELADADVQTALAPAVDTLNDSFAACVHKSSLGELCDDSSAGDLANWLEIYRFLQGTEAESSLGAWIADAQPEFGPSTRAGFEFIKTLDRTRIGEFVERREKFARQLRAALRPGDLLCIPTAPTVAPLKSAISFDRRSDYYRRALSLTSIAGVARLPQVSLPLVTAAAVPIGLSLLGAPGEDLGLIAAAEALASQRR